MHHPVLWFSNWADCWRKISFVPWIMCSVVAISLDNDLLPVVHGATRERGRSATMHQGGASKGSFTAVATRARCNSLSTNIYREDQEKVQDQPTNTQSFPSTRPRIGDATRAGRKIRINERPMEDTVADNEPREELRRT